MADKNCIFCKITNKEIPSDIIYEDKEMISFLDVNPVNKGHLLLIPKEHHCWMTDVPDELLTKLFMKSKELMRQLKEKLEADFVVLSIVGTDVPHFHIHILPRYKSDGLANFWPTKTYTEGEMQEYLRKIKE
jgi:histidine triad (HIT) family protein